MDSTEAWRSRDRKVLWHPFTQQEGWAEEDFPVIAGAEGVHLIDVDGRRYLDGVSSLWCSVHGHRVPALDAAVRAQLDRAAHTTLLGLSHPPAIELAERLVRLAPPGLARVFYSDSGSEAMEVALKIAFQYWQQVKPGAAEGKAARPPAATPGERTARWGTDDATACALFEALDALDEAAIRALLPRVPDDTLTRALTGCPAMLAGKVFRQIRGERTTIIRRRLGRHGAGPADVLAARRAVLDAIRERPPAEDTPRPRLRRTPDPRRKRAFLTFGEAYHGDTIGSVSLGGIDLFHAAYGPLLFKTLRAPSPSSREAPAAVEKLFAAHHAELAAAVIEPLIQGAGGMLVQPKGFLKRLRELCDAFEVLLICDEVATGFGRTGTMFACEQEGVRPDLMAVAKGLTGGYLPLAATLATEEVYAAFLGDPGAKKAFFHGHTYTGNPLACAAALASLDLFDRERVLERLPPKIAALAAGLGRLIDHPHVGAVRQKGLMAGIELVKDKGNDFPYSVEERMGHRVIVEARKRGAILRPLGNVIVLMPPLAMTAEDITRLMGTTCEAIAAATGA